MTAPRPEELCGGVTRPVADMEKPESISSASLRVLLAIQKLMKQQGKIVFQKRERGRDGDI